MRTSPILLLMLTMSLFMIQMKAYGQTLDCDTIYSFPSTAPRYTNDKKGLSDYFIQALMPIIANCNQRDNMLISSLNILLTIDRNGNVIDATFTGQHLSPICKDELMKKLLTMTGWAAAQKDGKPVCSTFHWSISCIKWE